MIDTNFTEIVELQENLVNLNFNDKPAINFFLEKLFSSTLLDSKWTFRSVLVSIYTCFLCKPHSDMNYINLFIDVSKHPKNTFLSDDYMVSFANNFFIYQLYKNNFVTIDSIYEQSKRISKIFYTFYPEIRHHYPKSPLFNKNSFENFQNCITSTGYQVNENDIDSLFEKFIEFRSKGENPDPIALSIRYDNIDRLQQLLSQGNISIDQKIKYSLFERFNFINESSTKLSPTLIEYAAYFGSIECFKFLYQNLSQLPSRISQFAIAGGNYEIIHLCECQKVNFDDESLMVSIRFFQFDIMTYLEDNFNLKKTIDDASKSIVCYNLRALTECEGVIRENPNAHNSSGYTVLSIACLNGDLDIINYLITTFDGKININEKTNQQDSPLCLASEFGHLEVVKYLSSLPGIDINAGNKEGATALHLAASCGFTEIVKFFCSLPNAEINTKDNSGMTPLFCAAKNGNIEIMKVLAKQPNIFVYDKELPFKSILECSVLSGRLDAVKFALELIFKSYKDKSINEDEVFKIHLKTSISIAKRNEFKDIIDYLSGDLTNK